MTFWKSGKLTRDYKIGNIASRSPSTVCVACGNSSRIRLTFYPVPFWSSGKLVGNQAQSESYLLRVGDATLSPYIGRVFSNREKR